MTEPAATDYAFELAFELDPRSTALLVIDMQYASACRSTGLGAHLERTGRAEQGAYRFDRIEGVVLPAIRKLLDDFRARGLPVVYVTVGSARDDYADMPRNLAVLARTFDNRVGEPVHAILAEIMPLEGDIVVNKTTTGAFQSTDLERRLRALGVTDLAICGVSTDQCVESTARVAADLGFNCVIVDDGCASASPARHEATLRAFGRVLGRTASSGQVIAELGRPTA